MSDNDFFDNLPKDMDISNSDVEQSTPIIRSEGNTSAQAIASMAGSTPLADPTIIAQQTSHILTSDNESIQKVLPVPQISIQAFFETPATSQLLQLASADRRMSRAHITLQPGGIVTATEFYQTAPTPNLIIIESRLKQKDLLDALDGLAAVCDAGTKVFIMGHENDIRLYRGLVSKGISDYLVLPTSPINLIETIYNIYHDPESEPLGKKYAFFGANGGVGSSCIAHNLAYSIATNINDSVTIVDLDFAFGTLGLNFNQEPVQDIADLIKTPDRIDEATINKMVIQLNEQLNILTGAISIEKDHNISVLGVNKLLETLSKGVANTIIDLPHVWNDWSKSCLLQSDQIVITATPDLASLRNTKNIIDYLKSNRHHDHDPLVILNQIGMIKKPEIQRKDFEDTIGVPIIAEIAYDPQLFGTAANNGQMIQEFAKTNKTISQFDNIAQMLVGKKIQQISEKKSLLDIFKKKKSA